MSRDAQCAKLGKFDFQSTAIDQYPLAILKSRTPAVTDFLG